eukprot:2227500-Alexandrium_andersonii.AAC.1
MTRSQARKGRAAVWQLTSLRSPAQSTSCRKGRLRLRGDWWALRPLKAFWQRGPTPQSPA